LGSLRFCLACCVAALVASCARDGRVPAVGTIERHRFEIAAPASEQIVAMPVKEGQVVRQGDLLAQLDGGALAASRDSLAAQASQLEHRLEELVHGARREERTQARAQLAAAEAQHLQARKEYERLSELVGRGLVAQSQVDQQKQLRDSSAAAVAVAQAGLELVQEGTRSEQLEQARAALRAAQSQLQQQEVLLARLQLVAPVDGVVEALPYRLGERPALGMPVVIMLAGGVPYARVYIPEPQRAPLHAGQTLQVHVDGIAQPFSGTLRYIAGEASFTPYFALTQRDRSRLVYLAEIDLSEPAARALPAGVPVEVLLDRGP
jgi:HlyD family secretion protein